ncbi:MAG: hypothetical protein RLZZ450_5865 [Pseudomonadota bacterium]|jgi:hypothetical protein
MTRYILNGNAPCDGAIVGYDELSEALFLQCNSPSYEGASTPGRNTVSTIADLEIEAYEHGLHMPSLMLRILHGEQQQQPPVLLEGDYVYVRTASGRLTKAHRVLEVAQHAGRQRLRIALDADTSRWIAEREVQPDPLYASRVQHLFE